MQFGYWLCKYSYFLTTYKHKVDVIDNKNLIIQRNAIKLNQTKIAYNLSSEHSLKKNKKGGSNQAPAK